jgi:hypothetical protein
MTFSRLRLLEGENDLGEVERPPVDRKDGQRVQVVQQIPTMAWRQPPRRRLDR